NRDSEKKSQSTNWTSIEEEHLAVSYITVGKEPKWANNQSGLEFWKKVTENFNARSNIHCQQKLLRQGCPSPIDWLCQAKALYASEKSGQELKHNLAWEKLQY
ncbi:hypothetical protein CROQUDRAFT_20231, partial [Cronartium quercuum f. sp. fusiforme G11]